MASKFGSTWWGERWLNALSNIDYSNRLPRGRTYANNGSVKSIEIEKNIVKARVQGRVFSPYRITIEVPLFSAKEKEYLSEKIKEDPLILSKLLNRELPGEILNIAESNKIRIFPRSWEDFKMNCSCPDWANPCKHIAAVIYLIANEIDKNPFIVFQLHGFDIIESLEKRTEGIKTSSVEKIPTIDDFLIDNQQIDENFVYDENKYNEFDFTVIPELNENLLSLLSSNNLFFSDDFKLFLQKAYIQIMKSASNRFKSDEQPVLPNEEFYKSDKIIIECDKDLKIINIILQSKTETVIKLQSFYQVINFLNNIEKKNIENCNTDIKFLYSLYHFSLMLLEKGAIIPQLFALENKYYFIRWIPAIIDEKVNLLFSQFEKLIPSDMVQFLIPLKGKKFDTKYQIPKEELFSICSFFLNYFVNISVSSNQSLKNNQNQKIISLFFFGNSTRFNDFSEQQVPNTIQLWLNRFYISHKDFVPLLLIEDNENQFNLDVMIENKIDPLQTPIPFNEFLSNKKYEQSKFDVLKNLTMLSEYFKEIEILIKSNGRKKITFDSNQFSDILLKVLPAIKLFGINILLPKSLRSLIRPQISLSLKEKGKGKQVSYLNLDKILRFDWQIAIGDILIDPEEFKRIVGNLSGIVKIRDQYVIIEQNEINRLFKNISETPKLSASVLLKTTLTEEYNEAKIYLSEKVRKIITELTKIDEIELPNNLQSVLRPYQIRGYEWLYKNSGVGFGSLLADDMGLGKTLQVIALLLKFKKENQLLDNKALIIVPTSLISNWQNEIEKFAPELKSHIYHGPKRNLNNIKNCDFVLSTYGIIRSDIDEFESIGWHSIIVDEAQNIKNPSTEQTKAVKKLNAKIKIAMTGTPVENRLSEYWSIFDFINKGYLGSLKYFNDCYAKPIQEFNDQYRLNIFKKITQPFLLRRLKTDKSIINDLPDKFEINQYCSLTKEQAAIYENIVKNMMSEIEEKKGIDRKGLVFKLLTGLKQICNHPRHFLKKGDSYPEISGKSTLLFSLLENIFENNEKTLIFTQYTEMGEILSTMIEKSFNSKPLFLHGRLSRKQRDQSIKDFQTNRSHKMFILSLKAGGTGLNLTAARNVIHYDLWWNPAVEAQASDRAYRIGQKENVMIYRLITKGTFEERIDEMLKKKKELANLTVESGEKWIGELSNEQLKELVKLK